MEFIVLETYWNNLIYKIEEDLPEIGAYLYCFDSELCVNDYLQNSIEECKIFALEEFGVPIDSWKKISNRSDMFNGR